MDNTYFVVIPASINLTIQFVTWFKQTKKGNWILQYKNKDKKKKKTKIMYNIVFWKATLTTLAH